MAYIYRNPLIVASPKGKVEVIKVLFDGKEDPGYSLAIVKWYGEIKLAIRWNIADSEWDDSKKQNGLLECIGSPQSRGHSTWFVFLISAACTASYGHWLSDSWWGAFIRNGGMGWIGLGMLAAAAAVDILSVWRRKNYDEYQILALERLMLLSGLLAVLLLPLSLLLLIFAPQHCIEGMLALLLLHWLTLVLLELWYFTRNYGA